MSFDMDWLEFCAWLDQGAPGRQRVWAAYQDVVKSRDSAQQRVTTLFGARGGRQQEALLLMFKEIEKGDHKTVVVYSANKAASEQMSTRVLAYASGAGFNPKWRPLADPPSIELDDGVRIEFVVGSAKRAVVPGS